MAAKIDYDVRCKRRFTLKEGTKGDCDVRYQWRSFHWGNRGSWLGKKNQRKKL